MTANTGAVNRVLFTTKRAIKKVLFWVLILALSGIAVLTGLTLLIAEIFS